ncbi:MAG TPA: hypothetical protein VHI97_03050, partial [Actinomycetota bacterium]|nr:hypothetical protein [Actinomycetota bacterium]
RRPRVALLLLVLARLLVLLALRLGLLDPADHLPEQAFYMVGGIEEAEAKGKEYEKSGKDKEE